MSINTLQQKEPYSRNEYEFQELVVIDQILEQQFPTLASRDKEFQMEKYKGIYGRNQQYDKNKKINNIISFQFSQYILNENTLMIFDNTIQHDQPGMEDNSQNTIQREIQLDDQYEIEWEMKQRKYLIQLFRNIKKLDQKGIFQQNLKIYQESKYKNQEFVQNLKRLKNIKFQQIQKKEKLEQKMMFIFSNNSPNARFQMEKYLNQYKNLELAEPNIIEQYQIKFLVLKEKSGLYNSKQLTPIILQSMRISQNNYYERQMYQIYSSRRLINKQINNNGI